MIKLHDEAGQLVAYCRLPYEFIVKANGNGRQPARHQALPPGLNLQSATTLEPPPASTQISRLDSSHMDPVLQKLAPDNGPTSGGPIIMISGINLPQRIVFVKFGSLAAPTV